MRPDSKWGNSIWQLSAHWLSSKSYDHWQMSERKWVFFPFHKLLWVHALQPWVFLELLHVRIQMSATFALDFLGTLPSQLPGNNSRKSQNEMMYEYNMKPFEAFTASKCVGRQHLLLHTLFLSTWNFTPHSPIDTAVSSKYLEYWYQHKTVIDKSLIHNCNNVLWLFASFFSSVALFPGATR